MAVYIDQRATGANDGDPGGVTGADANGIYQDAWQSIPDMLANLAVVNANGKDIQFVEGSGTYFFGNGENATLAITQDAYKYTGNGVELALQLDVTNYDWTASTVYTSPQMYYLEASGGGDPSITTSTSQSCAILGYYRGANVNNDDNREIWNTDNASPSGMTDLNMWIGAVDAGDDAGGWDTVYIRTDGYDPNTLDNTQLRINTDTDDIFNSNRPTWIIRGFDIYMGKILCRMSASADPWQIYNNRFFYADNTSIQCNQTGTIPLIYCNSFYWCGHDAIEVGNTTSSGMKCFNNIHYGDHVAIKSTPNKSNAQTITLKNNIFKYNGEGGFDVRDNTIGTSDYLTIDEDYNLFDLRLSATPPGSTGIIDADFFYRGAIAETFPNAPAIHDGGDSSANFVDASGGFTSNAYVGMTIYRGNTGESGVITSNTSTTIVATLSGGGVWNDGDEAQIQNLNYSLWQQTGSNSIPASVNTNLNLAQGYTAPYDTDSRPLYTAQGMVDAGFVNTDPDSYDSSDFRLLTTSAGVNSGYDWWTAETTVVGVPVGLDGIAIDTNMVMGAYGGLVSSGTKPVLTTPYAKQILSRGDVVSINVSSNWVGASSYTVSELPAGLTFSGSTISGTIAVGGVFSVTVTATNSVGSSTGDIQFYVNGLIPKDTESSMTRTVAAGGSEIITAPGGSQVSVNFPVGGATGAGTVEQWQYIQPFENIAGHKGGLIQSFDPAANANIGESKYTTSDSNLFINNNAEIVEVTVHPEINSDRGA